MNLLVVGGAGYIGSHMVQHLLAAGHAVVVVDNLSTGYRDALVGGELAELDIADSSALRDLFAAQHFDAVLHFASFTVYPGG
jgi:UDP-glucose 4-epimerase